MYQGDLIVGRLAMGADYLNPAAAVEFVLTLILPLPTVLLQPVVLLRIYSITGTLRSPFFCMTTPTTIDLDTELSAVNSIWGASVSLQLPLLILQTQRFLLFTTFLLK